MEIKPLEIECHEILLEQTSRRHDSPGGPQGLGEGPLA